MRLAGSLLLTAGFLAGAYVSVARVDGVTWQHYLPCLGVMVVGMVLLRMARSAALAGAGEQHEEDVAVLRSSLERLIATVRVLEAASDDEAQLRLHHRVDDELMEDLNTFVEARESLIPRLGMQRYADVMSPFANGERLINRAWSASADGYVDEVRACVAGARAEWERAAGLLAAD